MALIDSINKLNQNKTFQSLVKAGSFLEDVTRGTISGIARSALSTGLSLGNTVSSPFGVNVKEIPITNKIQKSLFGEESIKSIGYRTAIEKARENNDGIIFGIKIPESVSKITAPALVVAGTALDLSGFGTAEKEPIKIASKYLAKLDKVDDVVYELKRMNVADDLLKPYGEIIAKTKEASKVEDIINHINTIQRSTTNASKKFLEGSYQTPFIDNSKIVDSISNISKKVNNGYEELKVIPEKRFKKQVLAYSQKEKTDTALLKQATKFENKIIKLEQKNIELTENSKSKLKALRDSKNEKIARMEFDLTEKRKTAISKLKDKASSLEDKRNAIYQFTKFFPKEMRGIVNRDIAKATTSEQVVSSFVKLNKAYDTEFKNVTAKKISDIVSKVDTMPYIYQEKILSEVSPFRFKNISPEAYEKIQELSNFVATSPYSVNKFGKDNLKKLSMVSELEKLNIKELKNREIYSIYSKVKQYADEAKTYNKVSRSLDIIRNENDIETISKTANKLTDKIDRVPGTLLTKEQEVLELKQKIVNPLKIANINKSSPDVVMEMIDGKRGGEVYNVFKKPFDEAYYDFKEISSQVKDSYFESKKAIEDTYGKLNKSNFERIMIHATRSQTNGYKKLLASGFSKEQIDSIVLSKKELESYYSMRSLLDKIHPIVARTYEDTTSKKLGFVKDYFPLQNDFDSYEKIADRLANDYNEVFRTAKGFTKTRSGGKEKLNINAEDIFMRYVDDSLYYSTTEKQIKRMASIVDNNKFLKAVGEDARNYLSDWVELQARKGVPEGYKPTWTTELIRRLGSSMLGFNLSPVLKQPLAKITSGSLLGKDAFRYDKEFIVNGLQEAVQNISKQQKYRTVDDPSFIEYAKNESLAKAQEMGYRWIAKVDQLTSDNVWYNSYRKYFNDNNLKFSLEDFKAGKSNEKAKEYADYIVRRTQGTGDKKDAPMLLANTTNELTRAALQFQRFIINESDLITHDFPKSLLKDKDPLNALTILSFWTAAGLAEDMVSSGYSSLFTGDKEEDEKKFSSVLFDTYAGKIPGVNNFYSMYKYGSSGIPIVDVANDIATSYGRMVTGKEAETRDKARVDFISSLGEISGVPGIAQAKKIIKPLVTSDDTTSSKTEVKKIKNKELKKEKVKELKK